MNKQNFLKTIDVVSYFAIINATVFVILFQYTSIAQTLFVSLISYVVAFFTFALFCILRLYFASKENSEEFILNKKNKVWLIIKTILSILLMLFSIFILFVW